jgi:hypothetical protein
MEFSPELFAAIVAAVAFIAGLWLVRARRRQTRTRGGSGRARGPANLRFTCANCTKQFTHSRRTLVAYEQGSRQFFCNACHTRWRGSQSVIQNRTHGPGEMLARRDAQQAKQAHLAEAAKRVQPPAPGTASSADTKKGCLGAVALLVAAPAILGWAAAHYYF